MTAGAAAAAALVATGVTYASAPEVPSAAAATPTVNQAAPTGGDSGQAKGNGATAGSGSNGAVAGNGGDNGGRGGDNGGGNGGDNGGRGGDNGGGNGGDNGGRGGDNGGGRGDDDEGGRDGGGRDGGGRGGRGYEGRIDFNERSYSAQSWGCITVVSGLGSRSFNVRNDSRRTVEVFRGATCDNGSPVATVGPWSTTNGVVSHFVHGGVKVHDGVVGSFRVVRDRHGW
ncbi:hypothetical protein OHB41_40830 [Streptomyces sp. NBC_01571]|uniref:hypothetical protein n=1 Tax=Streptomyces sp. NBC_01571 TaxID=2975883 RepID=UPI00225BDB4B|nr:hypothetical protein [Streptomyces sp. NBC_01571]MCX4579420.1 hypothetical protein [Streptomyces sp. NBC_01571]